MERVVPELLVMHGVWFRFVPVKGLLDRRLTVGKFKICGVEAVVGSDQSVVLVRPVQAPVAAHPTPIVPVPGVPAHPIEYVHKIQM
jgi:hypothetical protein